MILHGKKIIIEKVLKEIMIKNFIFEATLRFVHHYISNMQTQTWKQIFKNSPLTRQNSLSS